MPQKTLKTMLNASSYPKLIRIARKDCRNKHWKAHAAIWFRRAFFGYLVLEIVGQMGGHAANGRCTCPFCMAMASFKPPIQAQQIDPSAHSAYNGGNT